MVVSRRLLTFTLPKAIVCEMYNDIKRGIVVVARTATAISNWELPYSDSEKSE